VAGWWGAGAPLPSTRALAADLGIARNTVIAAYDQLRTEGYVTSQRGGGTRVRETLPDALLRARRTPGALDPQELRRTHGESGGHAQWAGGGGSPSVRGRLSVRGQQMAAAGANFVTSGAATPVPFGLGIPALDMFPARLWTRLATRRWREGSIYLGDADASGDVELRQAIAGYLVNARGAQCTADRVLVVSGTQQALDLCARVLLDPGDAVWIEDPGYVGAQMALSAAGAELVPVPVDQDGLDVGAATRLAPAARLAYVTPSHQFPLGVVMSAARRLSLLAWAQRTGGWIIEDDYDSEFRYAGRPLPCLQGVEAAHLQPNEQARVLYVGTFSKTLVPGLRLGYLVVPDALVDAFRAARTVTDRNPGTIVQAVLADFIIEGHYARHLRRVRTLYGERQTLLLTAAQNDLAGLLTLAPDPAGLHLVGRLAPGTAEAEAVRVAAAHGVVVSPLSRHRLRAGAAAEHDTLLLGYAGFDAAQIRAGVGRLRSALQMLRHGSI
jgi:GntR family transcriptional regulator / MocR family aminotransferase